MSFTTKVIAPCCKKLVNDDGVHEMIMQRQLALKKVFSMGMEIF